MYIEYEKANRNERETIHYALWFAKHELLPRHKLEDITIEMVKDLDIDADCYDTDDRSFHIRIKKGLSGEDLLTAIFHEFVHIKQFIRKEYDLFSIHDENGKLAYLDRPYEIEAFEIQEELLEKFWQYSPRKYLTMLSKHGTMIRNNEKRG